MKIEANLGACGSSDGYCSAHLPRDHCSFYLIEGNFYFLAVILVNHGLLLYLFVADILLSFSCYGMTALFFSRSYLLFSVE